MFPQTSHFTVPGDIDQINLAAFVPMTRVLGPGLRAGVWVQGCPFSCPGCIAPEWIPQRTNQLVSVDELAARILAEPVTGLTLSGGEPFLQAPALASLVRQLRAERDLDVISFSGFTLSMLRRRSQADELLAQLDLLIDGSYVAARDPGIGLRGSDNQVFHYLTPRLRDSGYPFETVPRGAELHFQGNDLLVVGIPAHGLQVALDHAFQSVNPVITGSFTQTVLGVRS